MSTPLGSSNNIIKAPVGSNTQKTAKQRRDFIPGVFSNIFQRRQTGGSTPLAPPPPPRRRRHRSPDHPPTPAPPPPPAPPRPDPIEQKTEPTDPIASITHDDIHGARKSGEGGFGVVLVFRHQTLGQIALKRLTTSNKQEESDLRRVSIYQFLGRRPFSVLTI